MNINLPTLLDVCISLVFVFFIFSMFVSGIVELINSVLDQRAKLLRLALRKLLGTWTDKFMAHKLVTVKEQILLGFRTPITYLSADSFSTVLIDLLTEEKNKLAGGNAQLMDATFAEIQQNVGSAAYGELSELIRPMLAKSDSFDTFKAELETWYNSYMEQVSGWFKRYAQLVVRIVALLVAISMNVDAIYLTNRLFNDNGLRERLVAEAIRTTQTNLPSLKTDTQFGKYVRTHLGVQFVDSTKNAKNESVFTLKPTLMPAQKVAVQSAYVQFLQENIDDLKLPIGRHSSAWLPGQTGCLAVLGWLLTAAALSFGAPFWFDLLLKLVNIRNVGRRPVGNPDPS